MCYKNTEIAAVKPCPNCGFKIYKSNGSCPVCGSELPESFFKKGYVVRECCDGQPQAYEPPQAPKAPQP